MERKIGEIFEFQGKKYKVVEDNIDSCLCCVFFKNNECSTYRNIVGSCAKSKRGDGTTVIFKEVNDSVKSSTINPSKRKLLLFI